MAKPAVIQVIGFKNSGKTTIVCELIKRFTALGLKVGSIKHDAHQFEVDYPGKDSWKHRQSGASIVAITSKDKFAVMSQQCISLPDLLLQFVDMDLVLVEGYKQEDFPKIVILKQEEDITLLEQSSNILAVISWFPYSHTQFQVVSTDDYDPLFHIIQSKFYSGFSS